MQPDAENHTESMDFPQQAYRAATATSTFAPSAAIIVPPARKLPLAFSEIDPVASGMSHVQATVLASIRERFIHEIGGLQQNPSDPTYAKRWGPGAAGERRGDPFVFRRILCRAACAASRSGGAIRRARTVALSESNESGSWSARGMTRLRIERSIPHKQHPLLSHSAEFRIKPIAKAMRRLKLSACRAELRAQAPDVCIHGTDVQI